MNKERIKATISLLERMKTENPISNKDGAEKRALSVEQIREIFSLPYSGKLVRGIQCRRDLALDCFKFSERFSSMSDFNRSINIGLKEIGKEIGVDNLQLYSARHSMATIAANEAGIDRWTVNLMFNHTDQSMRVTELYIKRDFTPINEANDRLMKFIFGL